MIYEIPAQHYEYSIEKAPYSTRDIIRNSFFNFNESTAFDEKDIIPLANGMTESAFLVQTATTSYVIKLFDRELPKSNLLKLFYAYQDAYEIGVGPYIWHFDLQNYAIIMDFVNSSDRTKNVQEALLLLKTFHRPLENEPFSTIYKRISEIRLLGSDLMQDFELGAKKLKEIEDSIDLKFTLCHFDFHKDNFVTTSDRTYLIDFDDVDYGHPFYDIAKFTLREKRFSEEEILKIYLQREPTEDERVLLFSMIQVAHFSSATNRHLRFLKGGGQDVKLYNESLEALQRFLEN